jgi:hypothetical protein
MTTTYVYDESQPMHFSTAFNLMNQFTSKERDVETGLDYFERGAFVSLMLDVQRTKMGL